MATRAEQVIIWLDIPAEDSQKDVTEVIREWLQVNPPPYHVDGWAVDHG